MKSKSTELVRATNEGLYCEQGDFYIDPWRPVSRALITHAHSDHARWGSGEYHANVKCAPLLNLRLGADLPLKTYKAGEKFKMGDTWVSFHPAGHILGSSQVRIEYQNKVWVASGDYKRTPDPSCDPFEVVPCDTFISEATFALPVYKWDPGEVTAAKIFEWWQSDQDRPSLLFCYALGKAQRILAELSRLTDRTIYIHGAVETLTQIYRDAGIKMLPTSLVQNHEKGYGFKGDLILAPPSAHRSPWMKRFKDPQTAFASGWMLVRGTRRRKGYERGFALSDHADWNELNQTITETDASTIYLTHGRTDVLQKYLQEQGKEVKLFHTEYEAEEEAS
ncbi:ligase-associated DNA damage response exonuclease [Bdellovibrio sp. ZAP7]|uniref:ligase-associated DNA damage response exonuclease n=1 Tax=Bdellovibrio sp. ZAP7 TaxID=2231053 RepID=UPI0011590129|nr:ligase-associated DNA damage response exonuclease [Bdellovibrio sp. ZAP7]QDK45675.1 ligase-associated DNA damage response exonuclease [Bdellovibrio sp. ZAP7]